MRWRVSPLTSVSKGWRRGVLLSRTACVLSLLSIGLAPRTPASTIIETDFDDLVAQSEVIFEGLVESHEVYLDPPSGALRTRVQFRVIDIVKGEWESEKLSLEFTGGRLGEIGLVVTESVIPPIGERGVYFVESVSRRLVNPLYGWQQGRFIVDLLGEPGNAESRLSAEVMLTARGRPVVDIRSVEPSTRFEISNGRARGIVEGTMEETERFMSPKEFKTRIRAVLASGVR